MDSGDIEVRTATRQRGGSESPPRTKKPFPAFQLSIIWLFQFSGPVSSTVIYPFINQSVEETGITRGGETRTGYYVEIIESVFFLAECLSESLSQWGRLSNRIGRRPILLIGPLGFAITCLSLSPNFWMLVFSRCAQRAFNGNIGVAKSVMAEVSQSSTLSLQLAQRRHPAYVPTVFGWYPAIWGMTSHCWRFGTSSSRWPNSFGRFTSFHKPLCFLPCITAGGSMFTSYLYALFFLKKLLGGHLVYFALLGLGIVSVSVSFFLPIRLQDYHKHQD